MKRTNTAVWEEKHKRWKINVQKNGRRKSFYSSKPGRTGQREANAKADAWLDRGMDRSHELTSRLLLEYVDEIKQRTSTSNWRGEEYRCRKYLDPIIGGTKISKITEQDLQEVINYAFQKGLSRKTITGIRATIAGFIKYCRKRQLTVLFPENLIIPASAPKPNRKILQPEHILTLFTSDKTYLYGRECHDDLINAYRLQVLHGPRPGELIGLNVSDFDGHGLKIQRSINDLGEVTTGKNDNAVRYINLCEIAKNLLIEQIGQQKMGRIFWTITSQDMYRKRWKKYCDYNNIPYITPYEMRHTFVSVIQNLPEGYIKALVGHSKSMDTFGIYAHEIKGQREDAAQRINNLFAAIISG